jgi:hypothetical protein
VVAGLSRYFRINPILSIAKKGMMKTILFFLGLFPIFVYSQHIEFKKHGVNKVGIQPILQQALSLNHIDFFISNKEKKEGLTIVINDFIEPYYKNLELEKFEEPVKFKTYKEIYQDLNLNFIAFKEVFKIKDTLVLVYNLPSQYFSVRAKFLNKNNIWNLQTKNYVKKPKTIYQIRPNKDWCLAKAIKSRLVETGGLLNEQNAPIPDSIMIKAKKSLKKSATQCEQRFDFIEK